MNKICQKYNVVKLKKNIQHLIQSFKFLVNNFVFYYDLFKNITFNNL